MIATLVKILKLMFSKQVRWNCFMCVASFYFGSKVIIPQFKLYRFNVSL
jgi:hypothetical protein